MLRSMGIIILASIALSPFVWAGADHLDAQRKEVQALSEDIRLLEQINRLQLSPTQLEQLIAFARQVSQIRRSIEPKRRELYDSLANLLRRKRQLLLMDRPVPDEIEDNLARVNAELTALDHLQLERVGEVAAELEKLLSPQQIAAISGEYEAMESAEKLLQWLRGLQDDEYADEADAAAEELETPEGGLTAKAIRAIFNEARAMNEQDFEAHKSDLARKLLPAYMPSRAARRQALIQLLSNRRLLPLLEDKKAAQGG